MRTDSKKYSLEFIESTKDFILKYYEPKYINEKIDDLVNNNKSKKGKNKDINNLTQEAHEAIRPTKIYLKNLPEKMNSREKRMYKLIWENTLESCMSTAIYYAIQAQITSFNNLIFNYTSELINFPGWKIVKNKFSNDNKEYQYLQTIKQNNLIKYNKMLSKVTIKNVKMHYTEARLVQLLEEKGIGRPSTYSMLVDKIQERGYVKKEDVKGKEIIVKDFELENGDIFEMEGKREFGNEKGKLVIQPLGQIVMEFLDKHFINLLNYDFTKEMENDLDKISKGEYIWHELCRKCNDKLDILIEDLKNQNSGKFEIKIDDKNTYTIGKYGPVIKNVDRIDGKKVTSYKAIKKDIDINFSKLEKGEYNLDDIVENKKNNDNANSIVLGQYQDKDVILRKGKFGLYIKCGEISKTLKQLGNRPMENIKYEEILPFLEEGSNFVREINANISIRKSKKGDYVFFKTSKMKKPKFFDIKNFDQDYKICDLNIIKLWLKDKYEIY
jgi:DNA topoisomerase-1